FVDGCGIVVADDRAIVADETVAGGPIDDLPRRFDDGYARRTRLGEAGGAPLVFLERHHLTAPERHGRRPGLVVVSDPIYKARALRILGKLRTCFEHGRNRLCGETAIRGCAAGG